MPDDKNTPEKYILPVQSIPEIIYLQFFDSEMQIHDDRFVNWTRQRITDDDVSYTRTDISIERLEDLYKDRDDLNEKCRGLSDKLLIMENQAKIVSEGFDRELRQICIDLVIQMRRAICKDERDTLEAAYYLACGRYGVEKAGILFPEIIEKKKGG